MIKGLIINKFRGDKSILDPGVAMLEEKCKIPVVGVAPYMNIQLEDEDSLTERFDRHQESWSDRYGGYSCTTYFQLYRL